MILFNWIVHGGGIIYANTSDYALVCHVYAQSTCGKSATPFATDEVVAKLPQIQSLVEIWGSFAIWQKKMTSSLLYRENCGDGQAHHAHDLLRLK